VLVPVSNCRQHLSEVFEFAEEHGLSDQLCQILYKLGHGFNNRGKEYVCLLSKDFAPHSFVFSCYDLDQIDRFEYSEFKGIYEVVAYRKSGAEPWICGGLIYSHAEWSIHT
jgi:hypothetical protein